VAEATAVVKPRTHDRGPAREGSVLQTVLMTKNKTLIYRPMGELHHMVSPPCHLVTPQSSWAPGSRMVSVTMRAWPPDLGGRNEAERLFSVCCVRSDFDLSRSLVLGRSQSLDLCSQCCCSGLRSLITAAVCSLSATAGRLLIYPGILLV
jgi:hypothetical protein